MEMEFKLPPLGEGVDEVVVAAVPVKEGESVAKGQILLEVETSKAVMEIESLFNSRVSKIMVKPGDKAKIGQVMMVFQGETAAASPAPAAPVHAPVRSVASPPPLPKPEAAPPKPAPAAEIPKPVVPPAPKPAPVRAPQSATADPGPVDLLIPASPTVRKMAREMGVDLQKVIGSGPGGRILEEDVEEYVKDVVVRVQEEQDQPAPQVITSGPSMEATAPRAENAAYPKLPDFSEWGAVERRALNMVKRTGGQVLKNAWTLAPQVTHEDAADVTDLEARRQKPGAGKKITMTSYLVRAVVEALKAFPQFNCSLDDEFKELIQKSYFNIGIAVDTSYGLVVPVIRGAEKKTVEDIATELDSLARRARDHRLGKEQMEGGCFTISNLGGIGGRAFSPIINWPEVAILGVARARKEYLFNEKTQAASFRLMLPLCLTYDHRVIDGAEAARFMNKIKEMLEATPSPL